MPLQKTAKKVSPKKTKKQTTLVKGAEAPDFTLPANDEKTYTLSKLRGKKVLLYFYPKDNTSGCTCEAENFRDAIAEFAARKALVFGISTDSVLSHQRFAAKLNLPFPLLSDEKKKVVALYGVWGKKKMMGREYMGTKRMSFLIDEKGMIQEVYTEVKPKEHADQVLADLKKK